MKGVEEIPDLIFFRPLAYLLVRLIYKTDITPNQISLTAIVAGITAGICFSKGDTAWLTAGALFFTAFNILDCADGQLARLKKNGTAVGRIIDGVSDYIATTAVFLGIAFGWAFGADDSGFRITMLALAGASVILHGVLVDFYRTRFIRYVKGEQNQAVDDADEFRELNESLRGKKGASLERFVIGVYLRYSSLQAVLVSRKKEPRQLQATSEEYYRKNKHLIRLWLLIGPATQVTNIIIWSLLNRFDIFVWIVVAGFNAIALAMLIIQNYTDKTYKGLPE